MAATVALTAEYARECFDYTPETGKVTWRRRPREHFKTDGAYKSWITRFAGKSVGDYTRGGYCAVHIGSKDYGLHIIIWAMTHGKWPEFEIDHIDHCRTNNRISNLREVTKAENRKNQSKRSDNTSGITGVFWHKRAGKWMASLSINGRLKYLGLFPNIQDAANAVASAYKTNDFHANHGV